MKCFFILFAALVLALGQVEAQHQLIWKSEQIRSVNAIEFYPNGDRIVNGTKNFIQVRDASDGTILSEMKVADILPESNDEVLSVDVSVDGKYIVASGEFNEVVIYDADTYQEVRRIGDFTHPIAKFTSDGKRLIISNPHAWTGEINKYASIIKIFNVETWDEIREHYEGNKAGMELLAVSPSGNYFAYAKVTDPKYLVICDQNTLEKVAEYIIPKDIGNPLDGMEISHSGNYLIVHNWNDMYMLDIKNETLERIERYQDNILELEIKKDDSLLIMCRGVFFPKRAIYSEYYQFPEFSRIGLDTTENSICGSPMKIDHTASYALAVKLDGLHFYEIDWTPESTETILNSENIKIYLNPAEKQISIEFPEKIKYSEMEIFITDINGKMIQKKETILNQNYFEIDIDLPAGVYFLNINSQNFNATRKFVVE